MSNDHAHASHPDIVKRLKRAEGHVRRVIAMFDEGRSCLDLAQQLYAVEKAISEARRRLIHDHVDHCLDLATNERAQSATAIKEFKAISRYL
jgi:DNA-binding FrmR family transcriptional regulator